MLLTIHELESGQFAIQGCPTLKGHPGKCGKKQFRGENTTEMLGEAGLSAAREVGV